MATINASTNNPSILEFLKVQDPSNQKVAAIAELLMETNEVLADMTWQVGNLTTGNRVAQRSGLPEVYWRALNEGVPTSKSRFNQVDDACGEMAQYGRVDKVLADLNGNTAAFRLLQDKGVLEAMNQELAATLFYGGYADLKKFVGLSPRYSTISTDSTESGFNIIDAGGTESVNTSIWFVNWSPSTTFGIVPKGMKTGFTQKDMGEQTLQDSSGNDYQGYKSFYQWFAGLSLMDWRYNVRIANIAVALLTKDAATGADLLEKMIDAYYKIPYGGGAGRTAIYCNATIAAFLHKQARAFSNVNLELETVEGRPVVKFLGLPIRRVDQLLNTEARVV